MSDPIAAWLELQGVDVLAAAEAFALTVFIALVWGFCFALVREA